MGLSIRTRRKRLLIVFASLFTFAIVLLSLRPAHVLLNQATLSPPTVPNAAPPRYTDDSGVLSLKTLIPNDKDGRTTDLDIVVGIPTISRTGDADYLEQTLSSLLSHRKTFDRVVFVVFVADTDVARMEFVKRQIVESHHKEVDSGLIHIITAPNNLYPDWNKDLKLTLGDPFFQVKWRSKQNIDQAYMMEYVHSLNTTYYLMVEDDISAADNYLEIIFEHAESVWRDDLVTISYCKWGAIGKLFSGKMLPTISSYLRVFWNYKPLDWLISDFLRIAACRYPLTDCEKDVNGIKIDFTRQLFNHNGKISSLLTANPV